MLDVGVTVTSRARATMNLEVATLTAPCSRDTAFPSNFTKESGNTTTPEPCASSVATDSACVCTTSPGKTAEERGNGLPLSNTLPLPYSMAASELVSAATTAPGVMAINIQQITWRSIGTSCTNSLRLMLASGASPVNCLF